MSAHPVQTLSIRAQALACRDAAVQVGLAVVLLLAAADHQLVLLDRHVQLVAAETGDGQGDAKPLGLAVRLRKPFDVVGWIAVTARLGRPVEHPFQLVEAEQEGR